MAERIASISKEASGRYKEVTASVSNFVPKPHTPYQWNGMQTREYLRWAGDHMRKRNTMRSVKIKQHDVECSLLEGVLTRGDRRVAVGLEEAWRRGAGWTAGASASNRGSGGRRSPTSASTRRSTRSDRRPIDEVLPWDHVNVKKGREYLEKEQNRSLVQLQVMADAK